VQKIVVTVFLLFMTVIYADTAVSGKYWINAKATPTGSYTIDLEIETNIPGSITLAGSLSLNGQPNNVVIGTEFIRIPVSEGKAKITLDGRENTRPSGKNLPTGNYDVEIAFHPLWKENSATANDAKIKESIKWVKAVQLSASGKPPDDIIKAITAKRDQMKALLSITVGQPWDPKFWRTKYGKMEEVEYKGELNPSIIKMYYIESIDLTLMVNDLKKQIVTATTGLVHE
jgi:hypothetical protein